MAEDVGEQYQIQSQLGSDHSAKRGTDPTNMQNADRKMHKF